MNTEPKMVSAAWVLAAHDLGIEVIAPFVLTVGGREHKCLALVPHFGGGNGILVATLPSDRVLYADAKSTDYRCSFVDRELYGKYERTLFVETLTEWGFTGPARKRPAWLKEEPKEEP
jgi:hypothetical protein